MAKTSQGGTRALLHGQVGTNIYQVVTGSNRRKMQTVYAKSSIPAKPSSWNQAKVRLSMSLIERAFKWYGDTLKYTFEGCKSKQECMQEFSRLNFGYIKDQVDFIDDWDGEEEWPYDTYYDFPLKGENVPLAGEYFLSVGSLRSPNIWGQDVRYQQVPEYRYYFAPAYADWTAGAIRRSQIGLLFDFMQFVLACDGVDKSNNKIIFLNIYPNGTLDDSVIVTADNCQGLFRVEGDEDASILWDNAQGRPYLFWKPSVSRLLPRITAYGSYAAATVRGERRFTTCWMRGVSSGIDKPQGWRTVADVWASWYKG